MVSFAHSWVVVQILEAAWGGTGFFEVVEVLADRHSSSVRAIRQFHKLHKIGENRSLSLE
jgi:hypothetical protein